VEENSNKLHLIITCNFVIHPQILIFSVSKIANLSPYWLQINFQCDCSCTYLLLRSICGIVYSSQHWDVTAGFVNNQYGIQRRGQDSDKKVCIWRGTQQKGWQSNFPRKAGQSVVLISYRKSCGTQAQLTGSQVVADHAVPVLKKTLRQLII